MGVGFAPPVLYSGCRCRLCPSLVSWLWLITEAVQRVVSRPTDPPKVNAAVSAGTVPVFLGNVILDLVDTRTHFMQNIWIYELDLGSVFCFVLWILSFKADQR